VSITSLAEFPIVKQETGRIIKNDIFWFWYWKTIDSYLQAIRK